MESGGAAVTAPLAEVVEEGRRLAAAHWQACQNLDPEGAIPLGIALNTFYREHGPRLLAVAEAAVKYRHHITCGCGYPCSPRTAFDAAVRGEEK